MIEGYLSFFYELLVFFLHLGKPLVYFFSFCVLLLQDFVLLADSLFISHLDLRKVNVAVLVDGL